MLFNQGFRKADQKEGTRGRIVEIMGPMMKTKVVLDTLSKKFET